MNRQTAALLLIVSIWSATNLSFGMPARPDGVEIVQPDGTGFMANRKGDEWFNWVETAGGYSVAKDCDGYWYYIQSYANGLTPVLSRARAHLAAPPSFRAHTVPERAYLHAFRQQMQAEKPANGPAAESEGVQSAPYGAFTGNVLFILASFTNRAGTYTEANFASFLANNIKDYYSKVSFGRVTLNPANETFGTANNGVVGWVNLGFAHPDPGSATGAQNQRITQAAILAANPYVNFASYDTNHDGYVDANELAIVVIVAGYEESYGNTYSPSVWGHKWSLSGAYSAPTVDGVIVGDNHGGAGGYVQFGEIHQYTPSDGHQATMGIMVHELGHLIFGLPDLYDTDGSSSGLGRFCVMSYGSWGWSTSDVYAGQTPVMPCAWIRYNRGWSSAPVGSGTTSFTAAGSTTATSSNTVYRGSTSIAGEYFLAENRRPVGYDRGLERGLGASFGGMAIYHVDDSMTDNANDSHRWVDLEEADGTPMGTGYGQPTDLWYQGNATAFNDTTNPNTKLYSGSASGVSVSNISTAGTVMTANWGLHPPSDFNGDGKTDILWRNTTTGEVGVWLMNGTAATRYVRIDSIPTGWSIAGTGDFNGDGKNDILWRNTTTGEVLVWLMNGTAATSCVHIDSIDPAQWLIAGTGDFNGDGKIDILWRNTTTGEVGVWLMNGTAATSYVRIDSIDPAQWLIAGTGDFDGDGKTDILWRNITTGAMAVWLMNGTTVTSSVPMITVDTNWSIAGTGDYNSDGKTDILWRNTTNGAVAIWLMNGMTVASNVTIDTLGLDWLIGGTAQAAPTITAQPVNQAVTAGQSATFTVAATGLPPPAYQWRKGGVNLNNGGRITGATSATLTISNAQAADAGTYTVVVSNAGGSVTSQAATLTIGSATIDFNGDGKTDILWRNTTTGAVGVWLMNGTTITSYAPIDTLGLEWSIGSSGDFNGDGKTDILWRNTTTGVVGVWLMNGTTITSYAPIDTVGLNWSIAGKGDFNGDGKTDILWRNTTTGAVGVWLMNGTTITSYVPIDTVGLGWTIAGTGDFNGDGKTDILWRNTTTGEVGVWLMNGTTITSYVRIDSVDPAQWSISGTGDFNGDGKTDILWRNTTTGVVGVWLMNGTTITSYVPIDTVSTVWQLKN